MRKQNIPTRKRFALWQIHERRCFYCSEPLRFADLWIDHILPENLTSEPKKLNEIIQKYGLGANFSINDYCNWVPSCSHCNRKKGQIILDKKKALLPMSIAQIKSEKAKELEKHLIKNLKEDKIWSSFKIGFEEGLISKTKVLEFLQEKTEAEQQIFEPIVITFGLNIEDVLESGLLGDNTPTCHPELCDWLEQDLIKQLKSFLSCSFYYPEASARNGETLSVRFAFLQLDFDELDKLSSPWWEILEIAYYSEIYGVFAEQIT